MADEREFKILITGDAASATDAAKKSADGLGDLGQKVKETGEKTGETTKATDKFELSHRELLRTIHAAVPGVGELAHVIADLANPAAAATLAIGILVGKTVEHFKALEEQQNKASELAAKNDYADYIQAHIEQLIEFKTHHTEFMRSLDEEQPKVAALTQELARQNTATQERYKAMAAIAVLEGREIPGLGLQEQKEVLANTERARLQQQLAGANARLDLPGAEAAAQAAAQKKLSDEKLLEGARAKSDELDKAAQKAEAAAQKAEQTYMGDDPRATSMRTEADRARIVFEQNQNLINRLSGPHGAIAGDTAAGSAADANAKRIEDVLTGVKTAVEALNQSIATQKTGIAGAQFIADAQQAAGQHAAEVSTTIAAIMQIFITGQGDLQKALKRLQDEADTQRVANSVAQNQLQNQNIFTPP